MREYYPSIPDTYEEARTFASLRTGVGGEEPLAFSN